ncbi:MAG: DUF1631 family protein, partial [Cellvibrionales bacterium]|nr:DUF1631 family protein [Cellvibrionales bacterium]
MLVDKNKIIEGDSAQFDLALTTHFLTAQDNTDQRLNNKDKQQLASCLYRLIKNKDQWCGEKSDLLIQTLETKSGLDVNPIERAEMQFNIMALEEFDTVSQLDHPLSHLLSQCRNHLLINSLVEKQFLLSNHPLKQLVDFIHDNLLGFDAKFGKVLKPIYDYVEKLVAAVKKTPWNDVKSYQNLMKQAEKELNILTQRFFLIAERMLATEEGHLKAQQAKKMVQRFFVNTFEGKFLPPDVLDTLLEHIVDELKLLLVIEGEHSQHWLRFSRLLMTLVDLYQPAEKHDSRRQILLQQLPEEIGDVLGELNIHNDAIDKWLDTLKYDFYQLSQGERIDSLVAVELPFSKEANLSSVADEHDEYNHRIKTFEEGQWFLLEQNNQVQRVYLSIKLVDYSQYVFINMLGQKTVSLGQPEFAAFLKEGKLTPLQSTGICIPLYSKAIDQILKDFYERYEAQMQAKAKAEALAAQEQAARIIEQPQDEVALIEVEAGDDEAKVQHHIEDALLISEASELMDQTKAENLSVNSSNVELTELSEVKSKTSISIEQTLVDKAARKSKPASEAASLSSPEDVLIAEKPKDAIVEDSLGFKETFPEIIADAELSDTEETAHIATSNADSPGKQTPKEEKLAEIKAKVTSSFLRQTRLALDSLSQGSRIIIRSEPAQSVHAKLAVKF